ncbi:MAG TPA: hypothetical protein PKM36_10230 [Propionibacteriaceae bacterium]|nr:hypothetical protein [Propionibacteriaceae bacterium]
MLVEPIREVLGPAVAFKGRAITELWQTAVVLDSGAGCGSAQSPVWADASSADSVGVDEANQAMTELTRLAASWVEPGNPAEVTADLLSRLERHLGGQGHGPSHTFMLNALVPSTAPSGTTTPFVRARLRTRVPSTTRSRSASPDT